MSLEDTILSGDSSPDGPEFSNTVTSLGHNLVSETDFSTGWVASDLIGTIASPQAAGLGILGYYGNRTETVPLLPGSPAIDAGSNDASLASDERGDGFGRSLGAGPDSGSISISA